MTEQEYEDCTPAKAGEVIKWWEDCRESQGMNEDGSSVCGHVDAQGRRTEIE